MKKYFYRLRWFAIVLLLTGVVGCGQEKEKDEVQNITNYMAEFIDLPLRDELVPRQESFAFVGNDVYFLATSEAGGALYKYSLEKDAEPERIILLSEAGELLEVYCVDDTGSIYCAIKKSETYLLRKYDLDGNLISETDISDQLSKTASNMVLKKMVMDKDRILYLCSYDAVWGFQADGQFVGMVEAESVNGVGISKEGDAYIAYGDARRVQIAKIDIYSGKLLEGYSATGNGNLSAGLENGLLYFDAQYLYEYDPANGEKKVLLEWIPCNINAAAIYAISAAGDGNIRLITGDFSEDNTITLAMLSDGESDRQTAQEKEEIVIVSTDYWGNSLQGFIVDYNKKSDRYYITFESVFDEGRGRDSTLALLNAKILSQECPDLMIINYNLFQGYMEAGFLEDLTPYIAESEQIYREDYLDVVMAAYEQDGGVYGVPREFSLYTLMGRTAQVGDKQGWSIEEFISYLEENPDVVFEWDGDSYGILNFCLKYGIDQFVDFESRTCYFGGDEFKQLLYRIKALDRHDSHVSNWREIVEEGGKGVFETIISNFSDIQRMETEYGDSMTILGYPSSDGTLKCRLVQLDAMGIVANSSNKDGAWDVLEQYIVYYTGKTYNFPAKKDEFEEGLRLDTEKQYQTEDDGSYSLDENGEKIEIPLIRSNGQYLYALTDEQAKKVLQAIEGTLPDNAEAAAIQEIVVMEALQYFNDKKSLDEVIDVIQNRAQLYMDELTRP